MARKFTFLPLAGTSPPLREASEVAVVGADGCPTRHHFVSLCHLIFDREHDIRERVEECRDRLLRCVPALNRVHAGVAHDVVGREDLVDDAQVAIVHAVQIGPSNQGLVFVEWHLRTPVKVCRCALPDLLGFVASTPGAFWMN